MSAANIRRAAADPKMRRKTVVCPDADTTRAGRGFASRCKVATMQSALLH